MLGPGDDETAVLGAGRSTLLSLLAKVLGPGDDENRGSSERGRSTLLSLLAKVLGPGDDETAVLGAGASTLLSLLAKVLGPGDDETSGPRSSVATLLSLLAKVLGPGDDDPPRSSDWGSVLCHDVAAHAQCKGEASEHTGFERHGNTDTPELKRRPEWLEKNWHK